MPEGYIDLSIGEATVVRNSFAKAFDLDDRLFASSLSKSSCNYPPPNGYKPLVKLLEDQYQAPIIITTGAKQALAAAFYAIRCLKKETIGYEKPYWPPITELISTVGLRPIAVNADDYQQEYCDAYLSVSPNNPDGSIKPFEELAFYYGAHRAFAIPFIHDAAYYTPVYTPNDYELGPFGDVQIYSISKMYGLSGLRIGYAVAYDCVIRKHMLEYIDATTVGVSYPAQEILLEILQDVKSHPEKETAFVANARDALCRAKLLMHTLDKSIIDVPPNLESSNGMYLWAKVKNHGALKDARVRVCGGVGFGEPSYCRINLAAPIEDLKEAIVRLNEAV